ncbi:MAG TPA: VOC family protein [Tepidiformaceae bacterium]|nr:VOC family protein [Tepidiformaceae bacterium]
MDMAFAKINLRVRDLDAAVAYATGVLGATVIHPRQPISFGDMAMVRVGGLVMEIIAPASPDSPLARLIESRGEGIDSVGFTVPELQAASDTLDAAGGRMIGSQGGSATDIAWLHPKNPLSLSVELLRRDFWEGVTKHG